VSRIDVFVSFDLDHDRELYDLLRAQSEAPLSGFGVSGGSEPLSTADLWGEAARRRIREADQMVVICGEHTGDSMRVSDELRTAHEERTPYLLLWGRREIMCTKPAGAKPSEGMYSWTLPILQDRMAFTLRSARADAAAEAKAGAKRKA